VAHQKLGQHFLISGAALERLAAVVCPGPEELVVEIGPGRGALTEKLLARARRVVAIELDRELAAHLRRKFAADTRLEIVEGDVLSTDLAQWGPVPLAGNLPYYITSPILEKALRARPLRAVFLVQKEVAQRLSAQPGSRDYGYLTVLTATFARARTLFTVPPGAFRPPPKVESAAVLLEPHAPVVEDPEDFLRFAARSFRYKRKTLRNNLGAGIVDTWPEAGLRAEQLSLEKFLELYRRLRP